MLVMNDETKMYTPPGYYMSINPAYVTSVARRKPESGRRRRQFGFLNRLIREKLFGKRPRKSYVTKKPVSKFKPATLVIEMVDGYHWPFPMNTRYQAEQEVKKLEAMMANTPVPEVINVNKQKA